MGSKKKLKRREMCIIFSNEVTHALAAQGLYRHTTLGVTPSDLLGAGFCAIVHGTFFVGGGSETLGGLKSRKEFDEAILDKEFNLKGIPMS